MYALEKPGDYRAVMANRLRPVADDGADLFLTPPWGFRAIAEIIRRLDPDARLVDEPACGPGLGVHGLRDYFPVVRAFDKFNYGWGHGLHDFLGTAPYPGRPDWIVTNPPFAEKVEPFIRLAYARARRGVAMLLQTRALEGIARHRLYEEVPLSRVATFAERICMLAGRWDPTATTATSYSWLIFQKPARRGEAADASGARIPIPPGSRRRLTRLADFRFAVVSKPMPAHVLPVLQDGIELTEDHLAALAWLARREAPSSPMRGVVHVGQMRTLATVGLVELRGMDRLGDTRAVANDRGRDLLRWMGRAA